MNRQKHVTVKSTEKANQLQETRSRSEMYSTDAKLYRKLKEIVFAERSRKNDARQRYTTLNTHSCF